MAILNSICASWSDIEREIADFKAGLADIEATVNTSINAILSSPDEIELNKQADAAIDQANNFFAMNPIGSFNAALADSNIATTSGSGASALEDLGYVFAAGRYWLCNSKINIQPKSPEAIYGYIGIGDGVRSPEAISDYLGRTYVDPTPEDVSKLLKKAASGLAQQVCSDNSVTGSRNISGNIAAMREFYRGCGSVLETLSSFMSESYTSGFGVLLSVSSTVIIQRPESMAQADFTRRYVRSQLGSVVFDDDMDFGSNICYARTEVYLGHNIDYAAALKKANAYEESIGLAPNTLSIITRTIRFSTNEDVRESAPIIVSRKCNASALNDSMYLLGLSVNGVYRVIDVTGDAGMHIIRDTYTVSDIVDSINEVFGDLVECGSVGSDFFIKLKNGFGSQGSLSLFFVDNDCSTVIGMQNAITESIAARSLSGELAARIVDLQSAVEVEWHGGASVASPTPSSYFISYLNSGSLSSVIKSTLLTQGNYWDNVAASVSDDQKKLSDSCGRHDMADVVASIRTLEASLCYYDCTGFNYREFVTVHAALGQALHGILVSSIGVTSIDVYVSKSTVRDSLSSTLNELLGQDAVLNSTGPYATVSLPLELNYAIAARLRLLYDVATQYAYIDEAQAVQALNALCGYSSSVAASSNVSIYKTNSASTFSKILDSMDALTGSINSFTDSDLNRVIWNVLKDTPGVSELFTAQSYAQSKLDALAGGLDAGIRSIEDTVADIMSSLGLSNLNRKTIAILMQVQACLATAQAIATRITSLYNALTKKILALSNFNLNFAGSLGFNSKYVSCYATGNISATPLLILATMLGVMNDMADKLNKRLDAMRKATQFGMDQVICTLDKLVLQMTGTMTYESTMQAGTVSMAFQCTSYVPLGNAFNPEILTHIMEIRRQIDFLLASMQIQIVTFKKHEENLDAVKSAFTKTLEDTVNDLINKFKKCF